MNGREMPRPSELWSLPKSGRVVYCLTDPDGTPMYIGSTTKPRDRARQHLYAGWRCANGARESGNRGLYLWIGGLLLRGDWPRFVPVAEPGGFHEERLLLALYREAGIPLLNRDYYIRGARS